MDSVFTSIIVVIGIIAFVVGVTVYSGWPATMAQINDGYYILTQNDEFMQFITYDDRGEKKVQELIGDGWTLVGVSGLSSNAFTLTREPKQN